MISSFRDLEILFRNPFFQKIHVPGATMDILNVKQNKDETLSNYVTRFISETLGLECSNDELICLAF